MNRNRWLIGAGVLSTAASILHVAVIVGGPTWYRFFGAGEGMAQAAAKGSLTPALVTFAIAVVLLVWALYAFSGAGLIRRLPLVRTALVLITVAYLLCGVALVPALIVRPERVDIFAVVSSLVILICGLAYAIGTWTAWPWLASARSGRAGA
jgi:hypothetical protein